MKIASRVPATFANVVFKEPDKPIEVDDDTAQKMLDNSPAVFYKWDRKIKATPMGESFVKFEEE